MSKVTAYSDLYVNMMDDLPGITIEKMLQALRYAGRRFCEESDAFHEDLQPLPIVDFKREYALTHSYDASIHRIRKVKVNTREFNASTYDLWVATTLKFESAYAPNNIDDMLLQCGAAGSALIAFWQLVTAGSFIFNTSSDTYLIENLDFSGCADMDAVALVIQTAIRTEINENVGFCRWYSDKFKFWVESGDISYLTAGTSGTDISGAAYLNGLTGSATLASLLEVDVVFRPDRNTDTLPSWFMDRWQDTITALAVHNLAKELKKPWSDKNRSETALFDYRRGLNWAKQENAREFKDADIFIRG